MIELLVVIAIIAILAAMLLPGINLVRMSAKNNDCMNRHRQLGMMMEIYVQDNEGQYPYSVNTWNFNLWYRAISDTSSGSTANYDLGKLFLCSEDKRPYSSSLVTSNTLSIGYNKDGLGGAISSFGTAYQTPAYQAAIGRLAETVVAGDIREVTYYVGSWVGDSPLYPRHKNGLSANFLCADGRVSSIQAASSLSSTRYYQIPAAGGLGDRAVSPASPNWWDRLP